MFPASDHRLDGVLRADYALDIVSQMPKKPYQAPTLARLGLLRRLTRFSF